MSKRAERRFNRLKKIEKFRRVTKHWWISDEEKHEIYLRKLARSGKMCSCLMCVNERKSFGNVTQQEEKSEYYEKHWFEEH